MIADLRRDAPEIIAPTFVALYEKAVNDPEKILRIDGDKEKLLDPIFATLDSLETKIVEKTPDVSKAGATGNVEPPVPSATQSTLAERNAQLQRTI